MTINNAHPEADGSRTDRRLPRSRRIRRQADFDRVFGGKAYAANDTLVINACRNEVGFTRIGLSMSRKVGNAVVRNRWKRLIREAFRHQKNELPKGFDLIIRPRRGAEPCLSAIARSLPALSRRLAHRLGTRH